jgi:internalin A
LPDVKALVLGNGRIGKTQICRRLRHEVYLENADSTHGIVVKTAILPLSPDTKAAGPSTRQCEGQPRETEEAHLHLWDFGGQDLYHGTHSLFMRTRSLFVVVWTPQAEGTQEYVHQGITFRNYPLAY